MRVISMKVFRDFYLKHPEVETGIKIWSKKVKSAAWEKSIDVLETFPGSRPIKNDRVIFNLRRNEFRLIVQVNYLRQTVYVVFIGTHQQYDNIDPVTVWMY